MDRFDIKLNYSLFLFVFFSISSYSLANEPLVRVRLSGAAKSLKVGGKDISRTLLGQKQKTFEGHKYISYNCSSLGSEVKVDRPMSFSTISNSQNQLQWNGQIFQGKMHVIVREKGRGCDLVNEVPLETYISTLLAKEMSNTWPLEALKAQAVAARSYAFHKINTKEVSVAKGYETFYDLENSEKHQVNGSLDDTNARTDSAASQTRGEVLALKSGKLTPIFFHSKCGGKTLTPDQVWNQVISGYQSVDCPFCHTHGVKQWEKRIPKNTFLRLISKATGFLQNKNVLISSANARIVPDTKQSTKLRFYKGDQLNLVQKSRIRQVMGASELLSNYYHVEEKGNFVTLYGKGHGHGVGLCQYGAFELAKRGYNYRQILAHYFPEHEIKKLY